MPTLLLVQYFLTKWQGSEGNERANYQTFFGDICVALGVEGAPPKGSVAGEPYCFDKDIKFYSEKGESTRFAETNLLIIPSTKEGRLPNRSQFVY